MNQRFVLSRASIASAAALLICSAGVTPAFSQECGDDQPFGECRVLVEINSTDGDIGFHWLTDGDDLNSTRIDDPNGVKVFENGGFGALREQKLTESFGESAEPPCWDDGDVDPDEIVTLRDFRELWEPGAYRISGKSDQGEKSLDEDDDGNVFLDVAVEHWLPIIPAVGILWQF